jgi:Zn-dependent M32 family carboxypeptidase
MGKHEIRMRRQRLTARGTERFRNYDAVLKQHEQEKRMKKIVQVFVLFLLTILVIILFMIVQRWEKKVGGTGSQKSEVRSQNLRV